MKYHEFLSGLLVACYSAAAVARVGDGWGTNIHFTSESSPGEVAMLSQAYKIARMDFHWNAIESESHCGSYNFQAYDELLATMEAHGVRPYWILDYGNADCYPPAPTPVIDCTTKERCNATCPTQVHLVALMFHDLNRFLLHTIVPNSHSQRVLMECSTAARNAMATTHARQTLACEIVLAIKSNRRITQDATPKSASLLSASLLQQL